MHRKDPSLAFLLELGGGLFGFVGLGWIYAGRVPLGVGLLVLCGLLEWGLGIGLAAITAGGWCCVLPAQNLVIAALSGYLAYQYVEREG
jgi:hypothetical protein